MSVRSAVASSCREMAATDQRRGAELTKTRNRAAGSVLTIIVNHSQPRLANPAVPHSTAASVGPAKLPDDPVLAGHVALVVDDEPMILEILTEHCSSLGIVVREANDGVAALTALAADPAIEVLVTDVRMPGLDGPTLAERALTLRPNLKIIFVTGYTTYRSLTWPVLRKPFDLDELEAALRRAVA